MEPGHLLFSVLLVISSLLALKGGYTRSEDITAGTFQAAKDDTLSEFSLPRSLAFFLMRRRLPYAIAYHLFLNQTKLLPEKFTLQDSKNQYRRKVDNDKLPETNQAKILGNKKLSPQYESLIKMLFGQTFKMKTSENQSLGANSETDSLLALYGSVPDRTLRILSILAVFGNHFKRDRTLAHGATNVPNETVTITTSAPRMSTENMSCIHVEGYDDHRWIYIVNFCAQDWVNKTVIVLCHGALINDYVMTDTPVQDDDGVVYANRYCAFCNHVHVSKIRKWQIAWMCEKDNNPAASLMQTGPFEDLMALVISLRLDNTCKMIRTPAIQEAIQECPAPVLRGSQNMPVVNSQSHVPVGTGYPVSLNILMNFDFSGKTHIMFEDLYAEESVETKLCPQGNLLWDGELGRCREVVCAKGFHFDDTYTTCLKDDDAALNKDEEVITDLSQLAQSNDIERVTLEVAVPSGFASLIMLTNNEFWKDQIAQQLNISTTRIQQFNISLENATGEASTLLIQKLFRSNLLKPETPSVVEGSHPIEEPHKRDTFWQELEDMFDENPTEGSRSEGMMIDRDYRDSFTERLSPQQHSRESNIEEDHHNYVTLAKSENLNHGKGSNEGKDPSKTSVQNLGTRASGESHEWSKEDDLLTVSEQNLYNGTTGVGHGSNEKGQKSKASAEILGTSSSDEHETTESEEDDVWKITEQNPVLGPTGGAPVSIEEPEDAGAAAIKHASSVVPVDFHATVPEIPAFSSEMKPPAPKEGGKGSAPNDVNVIMSFILLPPEIFANGEKRSGHVVEALSSLVSSKEFKFIINGTSLQVQNMAQEDKVGVFSPACPHGLLLVLDGEQIELCATEGESPLGANTTTLKDLRTGKTYVQGMFDVSFIVSQPIGNTTRKPESFVYNALACEMPRITVTDCRRIRLQKVEYTIDPITKTLTFENITFNVTSYEFMNDNYDAVEICMPDFYIGALAMHPSRVQRYYYVIKNCVTDYEDWLKAEGYLTAVLGRISIVALFAVLLTYSLFPKLRNLPGVNTLSLTFALFLAEVIFAAGEEVQIPWLCSAVAASLHYCFLSSHCWMNVMSYDVCRTFATSPCILTRVRDKKKLFFRYAIYAWGMPLLVLGVCLFIDLTHVFPGISIGYGGTWSQGLNDTGLRNWSSLEGSGYGAVITTSPLRTTKRLNVGGEDEAEVKVTNSSMADNTVTFARAGHSFSCWITKPLAALFAFGAPILLIFLMNCMFFVRTIASIRRTSRLARHSGVDRTNSSNSARQLSGHNDVILYVKMSSVMGFTWVFGLASSIISSVTQEPTDGICYVLHVLGVLFPILNSSQGLFIFFAFVFNRRVLGLYKILLGKVKRYLLKQKKGISRTAGSKLFNVSTIAKE